METNKRKDIKLDRGILTSGIYCIENRINGKKYIGQSGNLSTRKNKHWRELKLSSCSKSENPILWKAVQKYGLENFEFYVIEECESEYLNDKEVYYIKELESHVSKNGYNILLGGGVAWRGLSLSEEHKRKIGKGNTGKVRLQEVKDKISKSSIGKNISQETRDKISKSGLGRKHTQTTKYKISFSHIGKSVSKETREKIKNTIIEKGIGKGENNPRYGKKLKNASSKFYGISFSKNKYWTGLTLDGKHISMGASDSEFKSIMLYDKYIIENKIERKINLPILLYLINIKLFLYLAYQIKRMLL